jgi:hypothetical protein
MSKEIFANDKKSARLNLQHFLLDVFIEFLTFNGDPFLSIRVD